MTAWAISAVYPPVLAVHAMTSLSQVSRPQLYAHAPRCRKGLQSRQHTSEYCFLPFPHCRHTLPLHRRFGATAYFHATSDTAFPGSTLSRIMRSFSAVVHRRRGVTVRISTLLSPSKSDLVLAIVPKLSPTWGGYPLEIGATPDCLTSFFQS